MSEAIKKLKSTKRNLMEKRNEIEMGKRRRSKNDRKIIRREN